MYHPSFAGIAVVFYLEAALVKGTVMLIFALLVLALLVYSSGEIRNQPAKTGTPGLTNTVETDWSAL